MIDFTNAYTPISLIDLWPGMEVRYSIYYQRDGDHVLLCRNVTLTREMLDRFARLTAPSYTIYIPNEYYQAVVEGKAKRERKSGAALAAKAAYEGVRSETENLLADIVRSDRVSVETAAAVADTVREQINTVEVSVIIEHINGIRKVDEYLHTHSLNVSLLNGLMGKWMRLDAAGQEELVKVGLLHDIGKLKIPPEILNKPAQLTPEEFRIIQDHPAYSREILENSGVTNRRILNSVLQHHEKGNGQGYPHGLLIQDIDDFARITAISDVYDAMVAQRVYKEAHSPFEILAWFATGCYSDLDIHYVTVFMDAMVEELKGKNVMLSDGTQAEVIYLHPSNFQYPMVRRGEEVISTSPGLYCTAMAI